MRDKIALITGAGWSAVAGYPLAKDLMFGPTLTASDDADGRTAHVRQAFANWQELHPAGLSEQFLADVAQGLVPLPESPLQDRLFPLRHVSLPWSWVVEYVQLRLASAVLPPALRVPRARRPAFFRLRYHDSIWGAPSKAHRLFLATLLAGSDLTGMVTSNYDLTAERALHPRPCKRAPGFYYDGLINPTTTVTWRSDRFVAGIPWRGEGTIPLIKLHGSLNWHVQDEQVLILEDARLAFRNGGTAAIVAPVPEKAPPSWLHRAWLRAHDVLCAATRWIVVGYSLPSYDRAMYDLFAESASAVRQVDLVDPAACSLRDQWRAAVPGAEIIARDGLVAC